jgi:tetracycline resistance efflux pump
MLSWLVLLPPAIVIFLSFVTKKVNQALLGGIIASAFIVSQYSPLATVSLTIRSIFNKATDIDNLYLYGFLIILSTIIILMIHSGSTAAYGRTIKRVVHTARGAESASLILSSFFFIDDYLSSLTVGSVMRTITDQFKIPRVKLSFLINMLAPAMAVFIPLSSWIALILSQLRNAGISDVLSDKPQIIADPFIVYSETLPYIFYSIIIVCATWFIVLTRTSFGPMRQQELTAQETGNLFGGKEPLKMAVTEKGNSSATLIDFIVPIIITLLAMPVSITYSGGFYAFGGSHDFLKSITSSNISLSLFVGSLIALILIALFYFVRRKLTPYSLVTASVEAVFLIKSSIILLLLASTFSSFISYDLPAGAYLAYLFAGSLSAWLLPFMFFVISVVTALATGSAWGTIAVMAPLSVQMLLTMLNVTTPIDAEHLPLLFPALGAVFSGAVAGTHISPIADNVMISTTSAGSYHIDHVQSQTPYVIPPIIGTGFAFLLVGLLNTWSVYGALGIGLCVGLGFSLLCLKVLNSIK